MPKAGAGPLAPMPRQRRAKGVAARLRLLLFGAGNLPVAAPSAKIFAQNCNNPLFIRAKLVQWPASTETQQRWQPVVTQSKPGQAPFAACGDCSSVG